MKRSLNPSKNITTIMFKIGSVSIDFTFSVDFQVSWLTASYFLFRKWQDIYFDSRCCDVLFFKPSQIYCTANLIIAVAVSTSARGGILALPHPWLSLSPKDFEAILTDTILHFVLFFFLYPYILFMFYYVCVVSLKAADTVVL